ncbi:MAG: Com family DNA-binding transcriptional regulator [Rhodobacter sp.]|nr:Com family DNA-binding transcriptional regulator [Rhodobacter sp.]MCA3459388.1 Com family DNA-binding transcriptional regulator [Rhodobacter sp.]MCA3462248.1 Com family DNA-binding transcriptional regulator [Rhodobacter sp.]MCA3464513.1 Com family DNA-binding transcriptional regulator [Rhodobacter sp.]MCA3467493.1 Com family DNA-binding transcriptional regulator [Rhodobacter sp.]
MKGYDLTDVRCSGCDRLLFRMEAAALAGAVCVKCPRCGAFNNLRPASPKPERQDRDGKGPSCGCSHPPST